jgi:hypothetical protein
MWADLQSKTDKPLVIDITSNVRSEKPSLPTEKLATDAAGRGGSVVLSGRTAPESGFIPLGPRVAHTELGELRLGISRIDGPADAAHVVAGIRKGAQEHLLAIVTDDAGKILRIFHAGLGTRDAADAEASILAGFAANTPGAKRLWLGHNHPSGAPYHSDPDITFTRSVHELATGSGITVEGMLVATQNGRAMTFYRPTADAEMTVPVTVKPRRGAMPMTIRTLRGARSEFPPILSQEALRDAVQYLPNDTGFLFVNSRLVPSGWLPMPLADMQKLRQGDSGPLANLLAAVDESNASAFLVLCQPSNVG